jgi:hypothetical protein
VPGKNAAKQISLDELTIVAATRITKESEPCTFERLVAECFESFPDRFCLKGYPQWPDSSRVNKCWLRCRTDRGWLRGTPSSTFAVTEAGERVAENVQARIDGRVPAEANESRGCDRILSSIRSADAFHQFVGTSEATPEAVREALGVLEETPRRLVRSNLREAQACARNATDTEALLFLNYCERLLDLKRAWKAE